MPAPSTKSLTDRRQEALKLLLGVAAGTGAVSSAPTPGAELPKQALIGILGDGLLLVNIYQAYFDELPEEQPFRDLLKANGIQLLATGGIAYAGVKMGEGVMAEGLNFVPGVGWLASGMITASVTATVGAAWWWYCERCWKRSISPLSAPQTPPALPAL